MAEEKRYGEYKGGCHCGYVGFSVRLSPPLEEQTVVNCNCSVCRRMGHLLVYPLREDMTWHRGSKERCSVYRFGTRTCEHLFCPKCGASIGIDFTPQGPRPERYAISVRSLNGVDLDALQYRKLDGMNLAGQPGDMSGQEHKEEA